MTQDVENHKMDNLCALKSLPSDVIYIISDYSDFRLGLSRTLRLSWEVNYRSKNFYLSAVGDDLFVIVTGENEAEVYFKGKLYSVFKIPKCCGLSINKFTAELLRQTIIVSCMHPDINGEYCPKTGLDTFDVLFFNINGELLKKIQIQQDSSLDKNTFFSSIDVDSNGNIMLNYGRGSLRFISTYSQQGALLQTVEFTEKGRYIHNDEYIFFIDFDTIEKHKKRDNGDLKKIISKIRIPDFYPPDNRTWFCCVPNHPEQIVIRKKSPLFGRFDQIVLIDFDNAKVLKVVCEDVPMFSKLSVGITGKITTFGINDARCYE